jgi:hypothetical protein
MDLNKPANQLIAGGIALVLIVGAWWLGMETGKVRSAPDPVSGTSQGGTSSNSNVPSNATPGTTSSPSTPPSGESVEVADQAAGSIVALQSVTLVNTGWVAVRDNEGRILGAARFDEGTHTGVVELLRNTVAGNSYQVLLYVDDGDREFDLHKDILVSEPDGRVAGATFVAR